eukprot:scaffold127021_cov63-Phaeocystis_antarctica.AAC.1
MAMVALRISSTCWLRVTTCARPAICAHRLLSSSSMLGWPNSGLPPLVEHSVRSKSTKRHATPSESTSPATSLPSPWWKPHL